MFGALDKGIIGNWFMFNCLNVFVIPWDVSRDFRLLIQSHSRTAFLILTVNYTEKDPVCVKSRH